MDNIYIYTPLKSLWKKEKMMITSILSFFHSLFYHSINQNHLLGYNKFVMYNVFYVVDSIRSKALLGLNKALVVLVDSVDKDNVDHDQPTHNM